MKFWRYDSGFLICCLIEGNLLHSLYEIASNPLFCKFSKININSSFELVTVKTTIVWIPNYETNFEEVSYSAIATASLNNTFSFAQKYLGEIAANRGECRAVRGFLRIPILSFDEIGPKDSKNKSGSYESSGGDDSQVNPAGPHAALERRLQEKGKSFDALKKKLSKDDAFISSSSTEEKPLSVEDVESWENISSIPVGLVIKILGYLAKG